MGLDHDPTHVRSRCSVAQLQPSVSQAAKSQDRGCRDTTRRRRRRRRRRPCSWGLHGVACMLLGLMSMISPAHAVFHSFDNCLKENIRNSNPLQLQFIPLNVSVVFNSVDPLHTLNITVYGNVSGTADQRLSYPPPDDSQWTDPNSTVGKIEDLSTANNKYSTLLTELNVLSFSPYNDASRFCHSVVQGDCPLAPVFGPDINASDVSDLRAFSVEHDMLSSFRFSTLLSDLVILSAEPGAPQLGCVSVDVTPDLGSSLRDTLAYVPLVILLLVGVATVTAAIYSPWGTTDPFRWTSNYGRDEDVIRLVTPGFGDCLQYIQFIVLTGGLSLEYPGYYQPVVSQAGWSSLMFNQSFMNPGHEQNPVVDGVYSVNATYGLDRLGQLVGMYSSRDIWPGMIVWLLAVVASVTLLVQAGFAFRRVYRQVTNIPEEDLRAKNMPFTVGNVIRIVFNYLFLPTISISFFQLVIAGQSPAYCVALAVIVILILIGFALWMVRVIANTRPKACLFDDLSTVLLYGPLYNTFCDDAAAFALVPIFISLGRGVAIGALQPSGIAQIVLLAICEVVSVLTLVAFRPFSEPTSMNLYHACFSLVRFLTILLSVTFVPSLKVPDAARGWIGYIILLLHALVLVFGFFLNALQTLIEVVARLAGAGGYEGGVTRGGLVKVLGMRQLSRRVPRRGVGRQSMGSEAAMLAQTDDRVSSQFDGSRPRSLSGNSPFVLNRTGASDGKGFVESGSAHAAHSRANSGGYTPTTVGGAAFHSAQQTPGSNSPRSVTTFSHPHDPYYRPPRPRRQTMDTVASSHRRRTSLAYATRAGNSGDEDDIADGPLPPGGGTPTPAYIPAPKDELDYDDSRQTRKDYAVREVDFYYRVRGPPLSQSGTRKLKTGPADPTGPVSSATGWFRNVFRGKTRDNAKGFEVVRSARAPPPGLFPESEDYSEPYRDEPEGHTRRISEPDTPDHDSDEDRHSDPPVLPPVDSVGGVELPSRMESRSSRGPPPSIPRRSSKRRSSSQGSAGGSPNSLAAVKEAVSGNSQGVQHGRASHSVQFHPSGAGRLPFSRNSSPTRERRQSITSTMASNASSHHTKDLNLRVERPSSMGYVAQYRARDNIHQASPDAPSFTESAAELVDEPLHERH